MKFSYKITLETGLHKKAVAKIVDKCKKYSSNISIVYNGRIGNTSSVKSLLGLDARQGDIINVIIDGDDEVIVYKELKLYFEEIL